jgi:hypothetical protein
VTASHLASCGSVGMWGKRVGTTYAYTPRAAYAICHLPWFRFRNAECERICREAWAQPAPTKGEYFVVADPSERPEAGWATRVEATSPLRKCSLARYEGEAGLPMRCALFQIGDSDFYQWSEKGDDFYWRDFGRLLRLNEAGRAAAQGIEAATADETRSGSAEGESPVGQQADAPKGDPA